MRLFTISGVAVACLSLAGCGGHDFEGTYQRDFGNPFMNGFAGSGGGTLVIGPDYIESQGSRTKFDKIFVRKGVTGKYLVFDSAGKEEAWKIVDKDTLSLDTGFAVMTMRRVKPSGGQ